MMVVEHSVYNSSRSMSALSDRVFIVMHELQQRTYRLLPGFAESCMNGVYLLRFGTDTGEVVSHLCGGSRMLLLPNGFDIDEI